MLALLVSTWVLSATPHALQSWEKASLASGTRIWDEPYQRVLIGRAPLRMLTVRVLAKG